MSKKTLKDIPLNRVHQVQQKAILRMHLYVTGETHRMLGEVTAKMKSAVIGAANSEGKLDGLGLHKARTKITATSSKSGRRCLRICVSRRR